MKNTLTMNKIVIVPSMKFAKGHKIGVMMDYSLMEIVVLNANILVLPATDQLISALVVMMDLIKN